MLMQRKLSAYNIMTPVSYYPNARCRETLEQAPPRSQNGPWKVLAQV